MLGCLALLAVCAYLVVLAGTGQLQVYALGNWAPPFGIMLLLDQDRGRVAVMQSFELLSCGLGVGGRLSDLTN